MRKLWVLLKLNFRAMLRAFSFRSGAGSSKKKAAGGLGALLLMAFLALYLSGVYSFLLASMLAEVGIVEMVLPLMALMACVMSLMFTLFAASGLVFGSNLTYRTPELLSRPWFHEVDVSKYIAYFIAALNHDLSVSAIIDPHEKIKALLERTGQAR